MRTRYKIYGNDITKRRFSFVFHRRSIRSCGIRLSRASASLYLARSPTQQPFIFVWWHESGDFHLRSSTKVEARFLRKKRQFLSSNGSHKFLLRNTNINYKLLIYATWLIQRNSIYATKYRIVYWIFSKILQF